MRRVKKLTPIKIAQAPKAKEGARTYLRDDEVRQLHVHITPTGHKSFVLYTRLYGKPYSSRLALGTTGEFTLQEARKEATRWLEMIRAGHDPRQVIEAEKEKAAEQRANTFGAIVADYVKLKVKPHLARPRFIEDTLKNEFCNDVIVEGVKLRGLADKPILEVTWQHLKKRIDAKRLGDPVRGIRPKPGAARHMLANVKACLNWAVEEESYGLAKSPVATKKLKDVVGEAPARERVLTDAEIRAVWAAACETAYPFGGIVQLLMLTAQRRDEASRAMSGEFAWETVDDKKPKQHVWTIPGERMKKRKVHVVPVTSKVEEQLEVWRRKSGGDYLFSTTGGDRPFSGFSKAKRQFDSLVKTHLARELGDDAKMAPWVLHDLRRTVRTRMSRFVASDVAELVINHQRQGVRKIYDRYDYLDEKAAALTKWSAVLEKIIKPERGNVVHIKPIDKSTA